jgi:hypothetical protein
VRRGDLPSLGGAARHGGVPLFAVSQADGQRVRGLGARAQDCVCVDAGRIGDHRARELGARSAAVLSPLRVDAGQPHLASTDVHAPGRWHARRSPRPEVVDAPLRRVEGPLVRDRRGTAAIRSGATTERRLSFTPSRRGFAAWREPRRRQARAASHEPARRRRIGEPSGIRAGCRIRRPAPSRRCPAPRTRCNGPEG